MDAITVEKPHAAMQQARGTMRHDANRFSEIDRLAGSPAPGRTQAVISPPPREFLIQGLTRDGKPFRPSDWTERLAGAMSCFRPEGAQGGIASFIGYSPYCVPRTIGGVKCVIVNEALRDIEPMAWDFVMNFARDNELQVGEASLGEKL